jgi:hypothetical protein
VKLFTRALPYAIWAALVVAALAVTAFGDPYVFGFTSLFAAWMTGGLALAAVAVTILAKGLDWRTRGAILGSVLVAAAAIAVAFARLGTYNWA